MAADEAGVDAGATPCDADALDRWELWTNLDTRSFTIYTAASTDDRLPLT